MHSVSETRVVWLAVGGVRRLFYPSSAQLRWYLSNYLVVGRLGKMASMRIRGGCEIRSRLASGLACLL